MAELLQVFVRVAMLIDWVNAYVPLDTKQVI